MSFPAIPRINATPKYCNEWVGGDKPTPDIDYSCEILRQREGTIGTGASPYGGHSVTKKPPKENHVK